MEIPRENYIPPEKSSDYFINVEREWVSKNQKLLDNTTDQPYKFRKNNSILVNNDVREKYHDNSKI